MKTGDRKVKEKVEYSKALLCYNLREEKMSRFCGGLSFQSVFHVITWFLWGGVVTRSFLEI